MKTMENKELGLNVLNSLSLFECLEHAYTQTKFWHQQTKSYAEHMALGGFYDGLSGLADDLVEAFVGLHERENADFSFQFRGYKEGIALKYMDFFHKKLDEMSSDIKESCLKNIIDEIMALVAKTKYLLSLK